MTLLSGIRGRALLSAMAVAVIAVVVVAAAVVAVVFATELLMDNSLGDGQRPRRSNRHSQRSRCHSSIVMVVVVSAAVLQRHLVMEKLSAVAEKRAVEHWQCSTMKMMKATATCDGILVLRF